jgi:cellulase/cellobiase CelA1
MFSTGQTVVVGVGLVMATALGFTTAKALQQEPGSAAGTPAPSAAAATPSVAATGAAERTAAATAAPAGAGAAGTCHTEVVLQDRWQDGYKVEFRVTNRGDQPVKDWTASFRMPADSKINSSWNADLDQDGTAVTVAAPDWGRDLEPATTVTFGFTASGTPEPLPGELSLDGVACS